MTLYNIFHRVVRFCPRLCPRKELYRATLYSCFDEYKQCYYNVKSRYNINDYIDIQKADRLSPEIKLILNENAQRQKQIIREIVIVAKEYCKQYPNEKICHFSALKTFDEFPYRLEQQLPEFIKML